LTQARVGLNLPTYGAFPGDVCEFLEKIARASDDGGIDTVWVSDHLTLPEGDVRANGGRPGIDEPLDPWMVLAVLAGGTRRVRVGTEVTPLPLRQPVLLAQTVASLSTLSRGRVILGVGAGWYREEFTRAGIPFPAYKTRMRQTREAAVLIRKLLNGETVSLAGDFYQVHGAVVRPFAEKGRIPIWFGGRSESILRLVAEVGDGWITNTNPSPDAVHRAQQKLRVFLRESGRAPDDVVIAVPFIARVAASTERARNDIDSYIRRGAFENRLKEVLEIGTLRHGIWGSPKDCRRKLEPYLALGIDHIILTINPPDFALDSTQRICGQLLPLLSK
jgi:probable F420-dependent oxidoreductase